VQERLFEVFQLVDTDKSGAIDEGELSDLLDKLGLVATPSEVSALFLELDRDGSGEVDFTEFFDWYLDTVDAASERRTEVLDCLLGSAASLEDSTLAFDKATSSIPDAVVDAALRFAQYAPTCLTADSAEPWRFYRLGPQSAGALAARATGLGLDASDEAPAPGCVVFTHEARPRLKDPHAFDHDARSATACAVQNFLLALHVEGLGAKWMAPSALAASYHGGSGEGTGGESVAGEVAAKVASVVGYDPVEESLVGVVWFGFVAGGLGASVPEGNVVPVKPRRAPLDDVLTALP